jgi:hypothetical protein
MINTFMLLLAFTLTDPSGIDRDERVHVLSLSIPLGSVRVKANNNINVLIMNSFL